MNELLATDTRPSTTHAHGSFWTVAILFFVVGDALTTAVGLRMAGVTEAGPVAAALLADHGLPALIALKFLVVAGFYAVWTLLPRPQNLGVPLGLAAVGVAATGWNLAILSVALA